MALSASLADAGYSPIKIETTAKVHLGKTDAGFKITLIELATEAQVAGIEANRFLEIAESAKKNCPVSQALAATEIKLEARLINEPANISR
jgi:lipoyl-dependent peroxiredoxin